MAVDKGGLRYPVEVPDQFSQNLGLFVGLVRQAREEVAKLRRSAGRGVEVGKLRQEIAGARSEAKKLSKEQEDIGRSTGLVGKALKEEVAARRKLAKEQSNIRIEVRKARLEQEESFKTAKTTLGVTRQSAKAQRDVSREIDKRNVAARRAEVAQQRANELTEDELRKLTAVTREQKERLRTEDRLRTASLRSTDEQIKRNNVLLAVQKKINQQQQAAEVRRVLASRGLDPSGGKIDATAASRQRQIRDLLGLDSALAKAGERANRVSFTFRRLFGILAAFAAARAVIRFFNDLVRSSILFNAQIEQAELGIASLLTAVGEVRDPLGGAVDSSRKLVLAQAEARRQTQLLRQDALKTTATFEQLLDTFQVAIAPGFVAGLDIDEIRAFTVSISQAAGAIGLQQNQLAEEIRSILSGTIQARTTRIAVALGITNDDIRNAREAGVLAEFLEDRFAAFNKAGEESFKTFNGLLNRVRDGFQILLQSGAIGFFEEVKALLLDIFNTVTDTDLAGNITPSPQAVAVIQAITRGLELAAAAARTIPESLSFDQTLSAATRLGRVIAVASVAIKQIAVGIIQGISDLEKILDEVFGLVTDISDEFGGLDIGETVRQITRVATVLIGIQLAVSVVSGLLGLITGAIGLIVAPLTQIFALVSAVSGMVGTLVTIVGGPFLLAALAVVAVFVASIVIIKQLLDYFAGTELKLISIAKIAALIAHQYLIEIMSAIAKITIALTKVGNTISRFILERLKEVVLGMIAVLEGARQISDFFGATTKGIDGAVKSLESFVSVLSDAQEATRTLEAVQQGVLAALEGRKKTQAQIVTDISQVIVNNEDEDSIGGFIAKSIKNKIQEALGEDGLAGILGLDSVLDGVFDINKAFDSLSANIDKPVATLESLSEIARALRDDIRETADSLAETQATIGLSGSAADLTRTAFGASIRLRENAKKIDEDIEDTQRRINAIMVARNDIEGRILQQSSLGQDIVNQIEDSFRRQLELQNEISRAENESAIQRQRLGRAQKDGLGPEADAAAVALQAAEEKARRLNAAFNQGREALAALQRTAEQFGESSRDLTSAAGARLELEGQETGLLDRINRLSEERAKLESRISEIVANRIAQQALEASEQIANDNFGRAIDLVRQQVEFSLRNADVATRRVGIAETEVALAERQLALAQAQGFAQLQSLNSVREQSRARLADAEAALLIASEEGERVQLLSQIQSQQQAIAAVTGLIANTEAQVGLKVQESNFYLSQQQAELERIRRGIEAPLQTGLIDGVRQYINETGLLYQQLADLVASSLNQVTSEAAQLVADIFDPTANVNLKERAGRLLLSLGQQILQVLFNTIVAQFLAQFVAQSVFMGVQTAQQAAVAAQWAVVGLQWSAIASTLLTAAIILAASGGFPGFHEGGAIGRAAGGSIPNTPVPASVRPRGLHPSDRVPIWAAKDEFMIRARHALGYGHDVLDKLNRGLIDPMALRALAGMGRVHTSLSRVPRIGLAAGGPVVSSGRSISAPVASDSRSQAMPAYIVASESQVESLLAGGGQAMIRFLDENGYRRQ